jgi:phosphopantetheinyl transferase
MWESLTLGGSLAWFKASAVRTQTESSAADAPVNPYFRSGWCKSIGQFSADWPNLNHAQNWVTIFLGPVERLAADRTYRHVLSPADEGLINQIRAPNARNCTLAGRVLLRFALSHATGGSVKPTEWRFRADINGKPSLTGGTPNLQFSVSHTDTVAAVAVSRSLPVGIDVEQLLDSTSTEMANAFCCPSERDLLQSSSPHQMSREFTRLWTLKEAYSKMKGSGHAIDFSSIGFSLDAPRLVHEAGHHIELTSNYFETMWVSVGRALNHLSLAIDFSSSTLSTDLRVLILADNRQGECVWHAPNVML